MIFLEDETANVCQWPVIKKYQAAGKLYEELLMDEISPIGAVTSIVNNCDSIVFGLFMLILSLLMYAIYNQCD